MCVPLTCVAIRNMNHVIQIFAANSPQHLTGPACGHPIEGKLPSQGQQTTSMQDQEIHQLPSPQGRHDHLGIWVATV